MFLGTKKISIFFLTAVLLFVLSNFLFLSNKVLAQVDPTNLQLLAEQIKKAKSDLKFFEEFQTEGTEQGEELKMQRKILSDLRKAYWKQIAKNIWEQGVVRAGNIAFKNALRTFFSRIAYQTATYLASGDVGKKPLFETKQLGDFLRDVADTTLADTLDVLAGTNGFFQFDVCQPSDINLRLAIQYSLFGNFNGRGPRGAPRCSFREIVDKWDEWTSVNFGSGSSFGTMDNFLQSFKGAFDPKQTDAGIYLALDSSIRSRLVDEQTKALIDRANNDIKAVTEPITGFIRTPRDFVSEEGRQALAKNAAIPETVATRDIIADSLGIFTNTLAAKMIQQLFKKGLTGGKRAQSAVVFNFVNEQIQRAQANQVFSNLAQVSYSFGQERILEPLTQCQNPQNPGPTECVMNSKLVGALEQGLTVKEALESGQLRGDGLVGYKQNGDPTYLNDYPYRSLVIMRIHRILPVGWEQAALYNLKTKKEVNLQRIVDCYEDKNHPAEPKFPEACADMNGDGTIADDEFNPYYHLIDPNWVLKSPESYCAKKGFGPEIVNSSTDCLEDNVAGTRDAANNNELVEGPFCEGNLNPDIPVTTVTRSDDYCADRQSCLFVNDQGECAGEYGYCLKEQELTRFPEAISCQPQYNTCETLTRTHDNKNFSYLKNTLKPCAAEDAGCLWYSTSQSKAGAGGQVGWQWNEEQKIYLNGSAQFCDSRDGGCSKLTRMIPGVNAVVNGDFSSGLTDSWTGSCAISQADGEGVSGSGLKMEVEREAACTATTAGFIPVDPAYDYVLTGAYKSAALREAGVRVNYYAALNNNGVEALNQNLASPGNSWKRFSFELNNLNSAARYVKVILTASGADGDFFFDDVQLVINRSPIVKDNLENFSVNAERYQIDYSRNDDYARTYLKQAPDYLGCNLYNEVDRAVRYSGEAGPANCTSDGKYWRTDIQRCVRGGDASCANYAAVCQPHEVGCQGYQPLNGDPEVSAVTAQADVCPAECVGYDSYLELPTYFDKTQNPDAPPQNQNFIPETATTCRAIDSGCEQFTNLDEVAKGGEGIEYFTKLKQCVSPNNANIKTYYTWEGSDTTGYQLKKWEFLGSNVDNGPCTNIGVGSEECVDAQDNLARCSQADIDAGNADCRDFFNKNNEPFLTLQSRAIIASNSCRPYRRTLTGQIYNADPSEGKTCSPAVNGCREYKGNRGNNVRNALTDKFERNNVGEWQNSAGNSGGLAISNEAVYQGGHSLLAATSDQTVVYPLTNLVQNGRDYTLSFWAKQGRATETRVNPSEEPVNYLDFEIDGNNLTGDWTLFTLGPAPLNFNNANPVKIRLVVKNLNDEFEAVYQKVFYLDNVILKEYTNSFYAVKNSWTTPASCDKPQPGAFLGCAAYVDRQQQTQFLKGFSNLCSSSAIGCEAFLDTRNSTAYQATHNYNEQTTVPNDRVVYLVNDPSKQCAVAKQGCMLLGQPILDRQASEQGTVIGFNNTYKINNPDLYQGGQGSILCDPEVLFCSAFKGETGGDQAYFDPQLAAGQGENTIKGCYYSGGHWLKNGGSEPCPGAYQAGGVSYIPSANQQNYQDWVGLCPREQSTCAEYRNPNQPTNEVAKQCDAQLSPAWQGICSIAENGNGVSVSYDGKTYCQLNVNGVNRLVCQVSSDIDEDGDGNSANDCAYGSFDWTCTGRKASYDQNGQLIEGTGNCSVNNQKVCFIPQDSATPTCQYSLLCQSSDYLKNSVDKEATCSQVDRDAGCLLFHDTSNNNLDRSNKDSKDGFGPANCDSGAAFGDPAYCDANIIIKVKKDRQCGEWLECKTGFEQPKANASGGNEFVCLDLYRCSKKGGRANDCAKIVSTGQDADQLYNLSTSGATTQIDQIKNLSGYSHPGLKWNNAIQTIGYKSPEQALQKGASMPIVNGGFETYLGTDLSQPEGWLNSNRDVAAVHGNYLDQNPACAASLDPLPANVRSGHYSLRLNLVNPANASPLYCNYRSEAGESVGDNGKFYQVNQNNNYTLSFWAKSANGGQRAFVGLAFFNNQGTHLNAPGANNNGDWLLPVNPPEQKWKKYAISYGNNGAPSDHAIPDGAVKMRIFFFSYFDARNNNNEDRSDDISNGVIWFDDFQIEPVLDLGANSLAKDCRLYPTEDAPACSYQGLSSKYEGWSGYCLEPDPAYQAKPLEPNNFQNCLQWYPVDSLLGDRLSVFSAQNIGYADRSPLYYCVQTKGTYNYLPRQQNDFTGTYGYKYQSVIRKIDLQKGANEDCSAGNTDIAGGNNNLWGCANHQVADFSWEKGCKVADNYCAAYNSQQQCENQSGYCAWRQSMSCTDLNINDLDSCLYDNQIGCQSPTDEDGNSLCRWEAAVDQGSCANKDYVASVCSKQRVDSCSGPCQLGFFQPANAAYVNLDHDNVTLGDIGSIYFEVTEERGNAGHQLKSGWFSDITESLDSEDIKPYLTEAPSYYGKFEKVFLRYDNDNNWYSILMAYGKEPNQNVSRLLRFEYKVFDVEGGGNIAGRLFYYLKDQCSLIAQTVKLEGGVVKEKSWLGRLSNWVSNNILGYGKQTAESPYGSFYPPKNSTPEYWSEPGPNDRKDAPLYIYSGGSFDFGPSAGTPWSVPVSAAITDAPGRICVSSENTSKIGTACKTSTDCGNGVCGGIGKFCYNPQHISNGKACVSAGDCGADLTCRYPGTEQNPLATDEPDAISRLQKLFAKVYGVWKWSNAEGKYELCSGNSCGFQIPDLDISQSKPGGWADASWPKIDYASVDSGALKIPGGKVQLEFTANGSADELPIDDIWINWQDGSVDHFKGPFGYKPNSSLPYNAYHIYTCQTNEQGDGCVSCFGAGRLNEENGSCSYPAPVTVFKNHWGWCSYNSFRGRAYVDEAVCEPLYGRIADVNNDGAGNANDQVIISR